MRHLVKKIKFKKGKDANKMLLVKLSINFLKTGSLITTEAKAKALVSFLEKLLNRVRSKEDERERIKFLEKKIGTKRELIKLIISDIFPQIQEKKTGFFRLKKIGYRSGDGSLMAKVEWSLPVVLKIEKIKKEKAVKKKTREEDNNKNNESKVKNKK